MKGETYAELRLAALIMLGAETVAFCALLLVNSHAFPFATGTFHTQPGITSGDAEHSNLGKKGYGNWVATSVTLPVPPHARSALAPALNRRTRHMWGISKTTILRHLSAMQLSLHLIPAGTSEVVKTMTLLSN